MWFKLIWDVTYFTRLKALALEIHAPACGYACTRRRFRVPIYDGSEQRSALGRWGNTRFNRDLWCGQEDTLPQALMSADLSFHIFLSCDQCPRPALTPIFPSLGSLSMVAASVYSFGHMVAWWFLPDIATRKLVSFSHRFMPNQPKPGTPAFSRHYRIAYAVVVLGFLTYNLIGAYRAMPPNFYNILDAHLDFTEDELTKANRAFARKNHPDRGGADDVFIQGRLAYDVLKEPVIRFAYDRFGPEVATWTSCKTRREFLRYGLIQSVGYYIITGVGLLVWSSMSPSTVNFWRYLFFLISLLTEFTLIVNPVPPLWSLLFPGHVQYQHIQLLHQLSIFLSVALSRVAPIVFPTPIEKDWDARNWRPLLEQNDRLAKALDSELFNMLDQSVRLLDPSFVPPTKPDQQLPPIPDQIMNTLTEEMENIIIEGSLMKDQGNEPMKSLLGSAINRGRKSLRRPPEGSGWQQSEYMESREKVERWKLRESRSPGLIGTTPMTLDELGLPSDLIEGEEGSWLRLSQSTRSSNTYTRGRSMSC